MAAAQKVGNEIDEIPVARSRPHRHWKLELVEGTILVVLGCVAGFVPFGYGIAIFMWLMVIGGITGLITTLVMRKAPGFWWSLASAILAIGIATIMFAVPVLAVVGLPILLMCLLLLEMHPDCHAGFRTLASPIEPMGLDARQWTRGFVLGCVHRSGLARNRFPGLRSDLGR